MLSSTSTGFICIKIPSPSLKKNTEIRTLPSPSIKISSFLKIPCSKTRSSQTAEKNMSCGVVPNPTNTPSFHHSPKQKRPPPSSTKKMPFTLKFPAVRCSSSFRTRAAVEEGGLIGERSASSFYELLGISSGGSFDEIKKAYKQLARKYHPDVSPPDRTEEHTRRFIEVQEAYEILSDPSLRAMYDRDLARGLHLAFSSRRRFNEELEERSQWKSCWQDQVAELKRRSINKDSEENLSWGARMRRQRARSTAE